MPIALLDISVQGVIETLLPFEFSLVKKEAFSTSNIPGNIQRLILPLSLVLDTVCGVHELQNNIHSMDTINQKIFVAERFHSRGNCEV